MSKFSNQSDADEVNEMARPTKLTKKTVEMVQAAARYGLPVSRICDILGIDKSTHYEWLATPKVPLHAEYAAAFKKGEALCIQDRLLRLDAAAEAGDVKSDQWLLSHRFSQDFNTRQTVGIDPIEINSRGRTRPPTEEFEAAIDSWDDEQLDEMSTRFPHLSWRELRDLYNKHCREDGTQDLKAAESEARRALGQAVDED